MMCKTVNVQLQDQRFTVLKNVTVTACDIVTVPSRCDACLRVVARRNLGAYCSKTSTYKNCPRNGLALVVLRSRFF